MKSTKSPQEAAVRLWPGKHWTRGGYPVRHRAKLAEVVEGGGKLADNGPILKWPEDSRGKHSMAYKQLLSGDAMLLVIGPRGTGKTQLAVEFSVMLERDLCVLGKDWAGNPTNETNLTHQYYRLGDLFDKQKESFEERGSDPIKDATKVGLLILDELQEVSGSPWEMQQLTRLIDARYLAMKRTILIANLTLEAAKEFLGDSAWSRLGETGVVVPWDGVTMR